MHTVGPYVGGKLEAGHERLFADSYGSCLALADRHGLKNIAFCCISTGNLDSPTDALRK